MWINKGLKVNVTTADNDTHQLDLVHFQFQDSSTRSGTLLVDAFESWTGSETAAVTKYYYAGSTRVAMNDNGTLLFLLADHLGSSSVTYNPVNQQAKYQRYMPYGDVRGGGGVNGLETDYTFTGQYSYADQFGLVYFNARWYDPYLNHFTQPDTIIPNPGNPADFDRYAYVRNNPLKYVDPSGHNPECGPDGIYCNIHINRPGEQCRSNIDCYDAYLTFKAVVKELGYVPDLEEILYMTAVTEYSSYLDKPGFRAFGQEGLARNLYNDHACGRDGCQGDEIYFFMSAYEPWTDWAGASNHKTPGERASNLVNGLNNYNGPLWQDMKKILNNPGDWVTGKQWNRPWQWYGGVGTRFVPDPSRVKESKFGCYDERCVAVLRIDFDTGESFWMFTGLQDYNFKKGGWK